jgi:hypothetical protein
MRLPRGHASRSCALAAACVDIERSGDRMSVDGG